MEGQHAALTSSIQAVEGATGRFAASGSAVDGRALASACESLGDTLTEHLDEEEEEVLPIAARCVSPSEWGAMPEHALSHYPGTRVWLPFGLVLEAMPDDVRENLLAHVPPPVSEMWFGAGSAAFANEMAFVRQGAS
jgi:hypothetical protein